MRLPLALVWAYWTVCWTSSMGVRGRLVETTPNFGPGGAATIPLNIRPDGSYAFAYDTGSGRHQSFRVEMRSKHGRVAGRYGYVDPGGALRITEYVADTRGYRATVEVYQPVNSFPLEEDLLIIGPIPQSTRRDSSSSRDTLRSDQTTQVPTPSPTEDLFLLPPAEEEGEERAPDVVDGEGAGMSEFAAEDDLDGNVAVNSFMSPGGVTSVMVAGEELLIIGPIPQSVRQRMPIPRVEEVSSDQNDAFVVPTAVPFASSLLASRVAPSKVLTVTGNDIPNIPSEALVPKTPPPKKTNGSPGVLGIPGLSRVPMLPVTYLPAFRDPPVVDPVA